MKIVLTVLAVLIVAFSTRAELFELARYDGTLTAHGTTNSISVQCLNGGVVGLGVGDSYGVYGTLTERNGIRRISIQTSTNPFVGTIKGGVVRGTYKHFTSGVTGTFQCDPPR